MYRLKVYVKEACWLKAAPGCSSLEDVHQSGCQALEAGVVCSGRKR